MLVDITFDNQYFVLSSNYIFELNVIRNAFTREIPNAWMLKKITDIKHTERKFINDYKGTNRSDLQEFANVITTKLNEGYGLFSSEDLEEA